jgi:hypothetical protein
MSIYVDPLFACLKNKNWKYDKSCHLIGDTEKELHSFAKKLGLKREWFHTHPKLNHYDLYKNTRAKAVKMGAIEITRREIVEMMKPRGK